MSKLTRFLTIRMVLIFGFGFAALYFILMTENWLVSLWFILFSAFSIYEMIHFLERSKRDLATFITGIKQHDFSTSYLGRSYSKTDDMLYAAFTSISDEFKQLRKQKESNFHFLHAVVEHSGIPMIGYNVAT